MPYKNAVASSSRGGVFTNDQQWQPNSNSGQVRELKAKIDGIDVEVERIDASMAQLQALRREQTDLKVTLQEQLKKIAAGAKHKKGHHDTMDYFQHYAWTAAMKRKLKDMFNIDNFRLAQEGYVFN